MKREDSLTSTLTQLRDKAYNDAKEKGFHDKEYPDEHWLMLIVCEIAEAVEADRQGRRARMADYDGMPNSVGFRMYVKDTVEDELADVCIRVLDFLGLKKVGVRENIDKLVEFSANAYRGSESFCETMLAFTSCLLNYDYRDRCDASTNSLLIVVFAYCRLHNIDILRHIKLKMNYNKSRPKLHGKLY